MNQRRATLLSPCLLLSFLTAALPLSAQPELITDRPDQTESTAVVDLDSPGSRVVIPADFVMPPDGVHLRVPDWPTFQEERLMRYRLPAVLAAVRASGLDRITLASPRPRLGIVAFGKAHEDLRQALDRWAPPDAEYRHNERWGDGNGHAHLRAALLKPSLSIPIQGGQLALGTWQQVVFIDFDVRPRSRTIVVQILGDSG